MRLSINENTADPHYSEDLLLQIHLIKFTCNPEIDTHSTCNLWTRMHAYSNENLNHPTHNSADDAEHRLLCFLISSYTVNKYLLLSI